MSAHPKWIRLTLALVLVPIACADSDPVAPQASRLDGGSALTADELVVVTGERAGAQYALYVPPEWNGDLVVYAHGFIDPALPVALPTADGFPGLRDGLLAERYAVAYSSFRENGFAVKDGIQSTHQMTGIFTARFGRPERVFLAGHSLGGLVALSLAERFPAQYAGALPMCGLVGGSRATIDYIGHTRVLFDNFYPGVLPGTVINVPAVDLNTQVIGPVIQAVSQDPMKAITIAQFAQSPLPFASGPELVESVVRVIGFNFRGFTDLMQRTHGHSPFDNTGTVYTGALPAPLLTAVNEQVGRHSATADALQYLDHFYEPTGALRIPVLTLHGSRDPVAPLLHETRLDSLVTDAGASALLSQRTVDRYGHCAFETAEMLSAFTDLVRWVDSGIAPVN